jgi:predicted nucleic acid binding AN1-type Zn finger protein
MNPVLSQDALGGFFAWAPLVLGLAVYFAVWLGTRHEAVTVPTIGATYACAKCGRRGSREHMVPQVHDGAVSYYCSHCSN